MKKIIEMKFGSHMYGCNTPNSDLDLKGIYIPTPKEIILHSYKKTITTTRPKKHGERNTKEDIDIEYFSLDRFLELLTDGQTVALDMLFSPEFTQHEITKEIYLNRNKLLSKNVAAFIGYARQQASRYGIKGSRMDALKRTKKFLDTCPNIHNKLSAYYDQILNLISETKELISLEKTPLIELVMLMGPKGLVDAPHLSINGRNIPLHATVKFAQELVGKMLDGYGARAIKANLAGGKDYKALSHAIRVNSEAIELLQTGHITFPRPDKEFLKAIKNGEVSYDRVAETIEQGLADLLEHQSKSTLRESPDLAWKDEFIYRIYKKVVEDAS